MRIQGLVDGAAYVHARDQVGELDWRCVPVTIFRRQGDLSNASHSLGDRCDRPRDIRPARFQGPGRPAAAHQRRVRVRLRRRRPLVPRPGPWHTLCAVEGRTPHLHGPLPSGGFRRDRRRQGEHDHGIPPRRPGLRRQPGFRAHLPSPDSGGGMSGPKVSILEGNTFVVSDRGGNVSASPSDAEGLFAWDTRFLSHWVLKVDGLVPNVLSTDDLNYFEVQFFQVPGTGTIYVDSDLSITRKRSVGNGFSEDIAITNESPNAAHLLVELEAGADFAEDRKSTRLNSSHRCISYAVFCL